MYHFLLFLKDFLMWTIFFLKSLLNLVQYCFCFMFFEHEACGILASQPETEPAPPTLEGKVLTAGPPRKFWSSSSYSFWINFSPSTSVNHTRSYKLGELLLYKNRFILSIRRDSFVLEGRRMIQDDMVNVGLNWIRLQKTIA